MVIELKEEHKKETLMMIEKYRSVRDELTEVEEEIEDLSKKALSLSNRATNLTKQLESMREGELEFMKELSESYGPGKMDPINIKWIKDDSI